MLDQGKDRRKGEEIPVLKKAEILIVEMERMKELAEREKEIKG